MPFNLLHSEIIKLSQLGLFSHCFQVAELLQILIFSLQSSWFWVKFSRIYIKVEQIFGLILAISSWIQTLELLLVLLRRQSSCRKRIIIFAHISIKVISFYLLAHLFVLAEILDHFFVHIRGVSVPSISFHLPAGWNIFYYVISSNLGTRELRS